MKKPDTSFPSNQQHIEYLKEKYTINPDFEFTKERDELDWYLMLENCELKKKDPRPKLVLWFILGLVGLGAVLYFLH